MRKISLDFFFNVIKIYLVASNSFKILFNLLSTEQLINVRCSGGCSRRIQG